MTKLLYCLRRSLLLVVGIVGLNACAVIVPPPEGDPNAPLGGRRCAMMMDKAGAAESGCCCCKGKMGDDGVAEAKAPKSGKKCAMKMDGAPVPGGKMPPLPMQHGAKP